MKPIFEPRLAPLALYRYGNVKLTSQLQSQFVPVDMAIILPRLGPVEISDVMTQVVGPQAQLKTNMKMNTMATMVLCRTSDLDGSRAHPAMTSRTAAIMLPEKSIIARRPNFSIPIWLRKMPGNVTRYKPMLMT